VTRGHKTIQVQKSLNTEETENQ